MHQITLPEPLYLEAKRRAAASGQSLERFFAEAVQLHLHDDLEDAENAALSPEQVAIIRKSQTEIREGKGLTMEQAEQRLASRKAAWQKANPL